MKPIRVDLDQQLDREAWLSWRRCHLTATDSAALLGLSKYKTALDVYNNKMGLSPEKKMNAAMQAGVDNEPIARKLMSKEYGFDYEPAVLESGEYNFLAASLDAITADGKHGGEIKCVGAKTFGKALAGEIDESYKVQCQKQMYVADLQDWIIYFMFVDKNSPPEEQRTIGIMLERDEALIKDMIKIENNFWFKHILPQIPPPLCAKDFEQNDNSFENKLALKWLEMKEECEESKKRLEVVEGQLKELAEGKSVHYTQARVKLVQISRKGAVDWKSVCKTWKITEAEVEKYRKENSNYIKIRSEV